MIWSGEFLGHNRPTIPLSPASYNFQIKLICTSPALCSDYINPIDLCNRLNAYIVPEAAVHAFLTFLFVINGYWLAILLNLPLLAFNAKKYVPIKALLSTILMASR